MGFGDKIRNAAKAVTSAAVVAKANHDMAKTGYREGDHAGAFDPNAKAENVSKSAYEEWRLKEINGD